LILSNFIVMILVDKLWIGGLFSVVDSEMFFLFLCWPFGVSMGVGINFSDDGQIHVGYDILCLNFRGANSLCVNYG